MDFHVDVDAHPNETLVTSRGTLLAGRAWLRRYEDAGVITAIRARRRTGGYMDVRMPAEDEAAAREQLAAWLADYPLLPTIDWTAEPLADTVDDGFDVALGAQQAGLTVEEYLRVPV